MKILYPPRPKGKMLPAELSDYEKSGKWVAQRKFKGSRCLICITKDRHVYSLNRHGKIFSNFQIDEDFRKEILENLDLEKGKEYWLDGELMNKEKDSKKEIILFDVLQVGRYFFKSPDQIERLKILNHICKNPKLKKDWFFEISNRLKMAETFFKGFSDIFKESINISFLEGLILRKSNSTLDSFGTSLYETSNLIRCRKPFNCDNPKEFRSGGYQF